MNQIKIDVNDLIAALKSQRNGLADDNAMQAALLAELQRQKEALAAELEKKCQPQS